jgi:hypothetical protein
MTWPTGSLAQLEVALSGRVLAYEWNGDGVLFRAARQTILRVERRSPIMRSRPTRRPDDPA